MKTTYVIISQAVGANDLCYFGTDPAQPPTNPDLYPTGLFGWPGDQNLVSLNEYDSEQEAWDAFSEYQGGRALIDNAVVLPKFAVNWKWFGITTE